MAILRLTLVAFNADVNSERAAESIQPAQILIRSTVALGEVDHTIW